MPKGPVDGMLVTSLCYLWSSVCVQVLDQWVLAGAEETEPLYLELRHVRQVSE
jgi:hypothetical protein